MKGVYSNLAMEVESLYNSESQNHLTPRQKSTLRNEDWRRLIANKEQPGAALHSIKTPLLSDIPLPGKFGCGATAELAHKSLAVLTTSTTSTHQSHGRSGLCLESYVSPIALVTRGTNIQRGTTGRVTIEEQLREEYAPWQCPICHTKRTNLSKFLYHLKFTHSALIDARSFEDLLMS